MRPEGAWQDHKVSGTTGVTFSEPWLLHLQDKRSEKVTGSEVPSSLDTLGPSGMDHSACMWEVPTTSLSYAGLWEYRAGHVVPALSELTAQWGVSPESTGDRLGAPA